MMPIIYTPTVGKAAQYYSRVFRRGRGLFITPDHPGRIEEVVRSAAPFSDVRLMVVTDNEAILGIGDQGAGGMAISVGKLALYCAGAGIHPARTLPICLDIGTDNQELLDDPFYLGYRHPRLRGETYLALIDEFVAASKAVFPNVVIQWEDFRKDNALMILDRFSDRLPSFNDDIQGTGAVAAACVATASKIGGRALRDQRILIYGAGAAGLGIVRQLWELLLAQGIEGSALTKSVLVMDSGGIVSDDRSSVDDYKREFAWPKDCVTELNLDSAQRRDLLSVVAAYKPSVLIGASGQSGSLAPTSSLRWPVMSLRQLFFRCPTRRRLAKLPPRTSISGRMAAPWLRLEVHSLLFNRVTVSNQWGRRTTYSYFLALAWELLPPVQREFPTE